MGRKLIPCIFDTLLGHFGIAACEGIDLNIVKGNLKMCQKISIKIIIFSGVSQGPTD